MTESRNLTAVWRGLEAAVLAALGYLAATYLALDEHTGSALVDVVRDNGDKALGVAISTLILGFGLTRGPVPNISKVDPPPEKDSLEAHVEDVDEDPGVDGDDNEAGAEGLPGDDADADVEEKP